jgi:hypothetical protein
VSNEAATSIGEDFPREQQRCRELIELYKSIGPAGAFGAMMIEQVLQRADRAMASGDVVQILRSYQEMKECKE